MISRSTDAASRDTPYREKHNPSKAVPTFQKYSTEKPFINKTGNSVRSYVKLSSWLGQRGPASVARPRLTIPMHRANLPPWGEDRSN